MNQTINKALAIVFCAAVISLPAHWFVAARPEWSYWNGFFIDYWAPKMYVSQLLIWVLWAGTALKTITTRYRPRETTENRVISWPSKEVVVWSSVIVGLLTATQLQSQVPVAGLMWIASIASGPLLFWLWLRHETPFQQHLLPAVLVSVTVQAILGWYQWIFQQSLGGYWLLGQPNFSPYSFLAQDTWGNAVRFLPYGGTPHPNILAGWMIVGLLALGTVGAKTHLQRLSQGALSILFLSCLVITQSWSAGLSVLMLLGSIYFWKRYKHPNQMNIPYWSWNWSWALGVPLCVVLIPHLFTKLDTRNLWEPESLTRRCEMLLSIPGMIQNFPQGTGLQQNWLAYPVNAQRNLGAFSRQPLHHFLAGMIIELGICTFFVLLLFVIFVQKKYSLSILVLLASLPILSLDHYGYSTMSGQYSVFIIIMFFKYYFKTNRPNKLQID